MAKEFMSEDEKALFRDHMRSVKPLAEPTKRVQSKPAPPPARVRKRTPEASLRPTQTINHLSDYISDTVLSETTLSYAQASIPYARLRELKMGQIRWESRLDLHGCKTEAARDSLIQFIERAKAQQQRCLLIIHGKGGHQGAPPVVKNLINRWLPQFDDVLAFHSAQARDGGHGAVYVLLKRNRDEMIYLEKD